MIHNINLILFVTTFVSSAYVPDETFRLCNRETNRVVDLSERCEMSAKSLYPTDDIVRNGPNNTFRAMVLKKNHNEVFGLVWKCQSAYIKVDGKSESGIQEPFATSKELCESLTQSKAYNNLPLKCNGDMCITSKPDALALLSKYTYIRHMISKVKVTSGHKNASIINGECHPQTGYCSTNDATYLWESDDIIYDCPYSLIDDLFFHIVDSSALVSRNKSVIFQIINKVKICDNNIEVYQTNDGFFLLPEPMSSELFEGNPDYTTIDENYQILEDTTVLHCLTMANSLEVARLSLNNEHFLIKDVDGNDIVLYVSDGMIYLSDCIEDLMIMISANKNVPVCTRDLPVVWSKDNNQTGNGYLTRSKIIVHTSHEIDCDNHHRLISFGDGMQVNIEGREVSLSKHSGIELVKIRMINKSNVSHYSDTSDYSKNQNLQSYELDHDYYFYTTNYIKHSSTNYYVYIFIIVLIIVLIAVVIVVRYVRNRKVIEYSSKFIASDREIYNPA